MNNAIDLIAVSLLSVSIKYPINLYCVRVVFVRQYAHTMCARTHASNTKYICVDVSAFTANAPCLRCRCCEAYL